MIDLRLLREDPDTVRASQRARGESDDAVDDAAARRRGSAVGASQRFEALRGEQKQLGKQCRRRQGDEQAALLARTKELAAEVKAAEAAANEAEQALRDGAAGDARTSSRTARPAGGEDDYVVLERGRREPRDFDSTRATTWSSASCSARSTWSAARRSPARGSTS